LSGSPAADGRLESPQNPQVRAVRRLAERRERARTGLFLLEGERGLAEAVAARGRLVSLFYTEAFAARPDHRQLLGRAVAERRFTVSERAMAAMADTAAPQGVLAVAAIPTAPGGLPAAERGTLVLLVDGVADPGNLGAILRSAEAFAARAVWIGGGAVDAYHPRVVRAAAGALWRLVPREASDPAAVCRELAAAGFAVCALVPRGGVPLREADLSGPVALVVGGEARGVGAVVRRMARSLSIPMAGGAESLNAAAAVAVACYEARRQATPGPA
jgi:TrmH family RNA methyltransferase